MKRIDICFILEDELDDTMEEEISALLRNTSDYQNENIVLDDTNGQLTISVYPDDISDHARTRRALMDVMAHITGTTI